MNRRLTACAHPLDGRVALTAMVPVRGHDCIRLRPGRKSPDYRIAHGFYCAECKTYVFPEPGKSQVVSAQPIGVITPDALVLEGAPRRVLAHNPCTCGAAPYEICPVHGNADGYSLDA